MLKTKSTTETMGSSEISDQNDGLEGFNELEPTLPPRRKGSLRKAALEAAAEHGERDEDAPKRKRGRPKADPPFSVVFTRRLRPSMAELCRQKGGSSFVRELVEQHLLQPRPVRCANKSTIEADGIDASLIRPEDFGQIYRPAASPARFRMKRIGMRAACGFPSPAADYESEDIDLSAWLVRKPNSTFIVEASGDSMIDAGISDGDMLIFDRDAQPRGGDIVLALYDGNITVKRLRIVDGRPELHPENAAARYKVICPKSTEQFEIEGVLRGLCRRYS